MTTYPISAPDFAKQILQMKKLGTFIHIFPLIIVLLYVGKWINLTGCVLFSAILLYIAWVPLGLAMRHERIATSKIEFHDTLFIVKDKRGKIWRSMQYCDITQVDVVQMASFMSGYYGINGIAPYVVLSSSHFNGSFHGSFYKKYTSEQFFPIFYNREVLQTIAEKIPRLSMQCERVFL